MSRWDEAGGIGAVKASESLSERGKAVRSALMAAALEVFGEKGFNGATVGEICGRAGANRAMIAYHFDNKAGLYVAVLDELVDEAKRGMDAAMDASVDVDRDPVDAWVDALANLYHHRPALARLVVRGMLDGDFAALQPASEALKGFFSLSQAMLKQASAKYPRLQKYDPRILHLVCAGALIHFSLTANFRASEARRLGVSQPGPEGFAAALAALLKGT